MNRLFLHNLKGKIRTQFIAGFAAIIPLAVTFFALKFLFDASEKISRPLLERTLGFSVPGVGIIMAVILIYIVGILATNLIGRRILRFGEQILLKIPLAKNIYIASKQLIEVTMAKDSTAFKRVVLVEFPRPGMKSIALVTKVIVDKDTGRRFVSMFIPTTPNPTTGFMQIVPEEETIGLNLTVEEAMKIIISGGILLPREMSLSDARVESSSVGVPRG
ncbi:MAG: DUF502 domain-containing protein [bacterium]